MQTATVLHDIFFIKKEIHACTTALAFIFQNYLKENKTKTITCFHSSWQAFKYLYARRKLYFNSLLYVEEINLFQ